ncbi:testican-2 [Alligator sinensis]|uniref:Testican-2 n=1 Tax=Alligator sinensis TaxID=38654 RepID=A0A1U7S290_ALLSI|nr:testican-2 [Alligator sinensis]
MGEDGESVTKRSAGGPFSVCGSVGKKALAAGVQQPKWRKISGEEITPLKSIEVTLCNVCPSTRGCEGLKYLPPGCVRKLAEQEGSQDSIVSKDLQFGLLNVTYYSRVESCIRITVNSSAPNMTQTCQDTVASAPRGNQNVLEEEVEDDYIKSWEDNQPVDEALDTTKDPCQKVKCSRHKVCIAQGYQRAMCISRKKLEHRIKQPALKLHGNKESFCKPCHMTQLASVCGSDGHTYSSVCKLEQQACLTSKQLTVKCEGQCPCPTEHSPTSTTDTKQDTCTGQDLADLGDRLRDWFQLLHENSKQNGSGSPGTNPINVLDKSLVASCKDSIGWMFSKLDTNSDLFLDQTELAAINLDKYEICIRPFFNSCDTYKDGHVSTAEWCFCFWREKPPCLTELERIQIQEAAKKKPGVFIPSCDEDGYYRKMQCDQSSGECWCVDQLGMELTGTRIHGNPDCDDIVGFSGDFGSGVGWEDEEEKETEEAGEEAEEEEGEAGEADDGGYIW